MERGVNQEASYATYLLDAYEEQPYQQRALFGR